MKLKHYVKTFIGVIIASVITLALTGCANSSGSGTAKPATAGIYSVKITAPKDTIENGETLTLTASVTLNETDGTKTTTKDVNPDELIFNWGPTESTATSWSYLDNSSSVENKNTFTFKGKNASGKSQQLYITCTVTKKDNSKVGSSQKIILVKS